MTYAPRMASATGGMSLHTSLWVLVCIAIVGVYLALSVALREGRTRRVRRFRTQSPTVRPQLAASLVAGRSRVVVASQSRCPLCRVVLARVGERVEGFVTAPVLLTYEPAAEWHGLPPGITVVQDEASWAQIAHLIPPVLMQVDADGQVTDLVVPSDEAAVDAALTRWSGTC